MKLLIIATLIPSILYAAAGPKDSPLRNNIHSKSAGEISHVSGIEAVSQAINILQRPARSTSEVELPTNDLWASPPSSSQSPIWISPSVIRSPSQARALHMGSKPAPKKSCKDLNEVDEKIWREQRNRLPRLQRSSSVPSNMILHQQILADSVKTASSARLLARVAYSQEQTQRSLNVAIKDLKDCGSRLDQFAGRISSLSIKVEGLFCQYATLLSAFEGTVADMNNILKRLPASTERASSSSEPTSPRSSIESSKASVDKDRRQRTGERASGSNEPISPRSSIESSRGSIDRDRRSRPSGSFLGSLGFGHKD